MKRIFSSRIVSVASSVLASITTVALVGYAATTISTDIDTAGNLDVTGTVTAKGTLNFNSASATTTVSGGLRADTADNTLVVDFSSSRVGIGTTSPSVLFSVTGNSVFGGTVNVTSDLLFTGTSATTTIRGGLRADDADNTLVVDFSSSRVGIGTTSPSSLLSVQGNAIFGSADASIASFRAGDLQFNSNATTTITTPQTRGININSGDLVLDTASTTGLLYVGSTTPLRGNLTVDGTGTTTLIISTTAIAPTGTCIELNNATNGGVMRMYATSSDIGTIRVEPGTCY